MQFSIAPDRPDPIERRCDKCGGTGRVQCWRRNFMSCVVCSDEHVAEGEALPCDEDERITCDDCNGRGR